MVYLLVGINYEQGFSHSTTIELPYDEERLRELNAEQMLEVQKIMRKVLAEHNDNGNPDEMLLIANGPDTPNVILHLS